VHAGIRTRLGRSLAAAVLGVLVGLGAGLAGGVGGVGVAHADGTSEDFCTLDLTDGSYTCSGQTSEPVTTAVTVSAQLAAPQLFAAASPGSVLLARLYDAPNRSTASGYLDVFAPGGCDWSMDMDWSLGTMPSGWNDRVSSFQGFNHCAVKLWQNGGLTGSAYGPIYSANGVGGLDNQASSVSFH